MDRLAEQGVLFEHAYSQSPVCTPSRASFLTGRYPRTTRCRTNGQDIPEDEVLVTKLLADAGYTCGLAGKLHLSACNPSVAPAAERRIDDGYATFHWSHHPSALPPEGSSGNSWPTNEYNLWLQERGVRFAATPFEGSKYVQVSVPAEHHQTTWCAQKAIDFIETNAGFDRPWLFSVNMFDPHHAFDPPEAYLRRYLDKLERAESFWRLVEADKGSVSTMPDSSTFSCSRLVSSSRQAIAYFTAKWAHKTAENDRSIWRKLGSNSRKMGT